MISEDRGNLLNAPVEALVNTVNTEGVMGKGIALQFKNAFPAMFKDYSLAAKRGEIKLGEMHVWPTQALDGPRYVINFPTKAHWRSRSRISDIEQGLARLVAVVRDLGIKSIAVPPLGCGNGGLRWAEVEPMIREAFAPLVDVDVRIYPPAGAPDPRDMTVRTPKPKMTPGRAALVEILHRYSRQALDAPSQVEAQKLMYFLQELGEPLRLKFEANRYGPYADNLRHVFAQVEGHFLTGFGDGSSKVADRVPLVPIPTVIPDAEDLLSGHADTRERLERVLRLIEGYESPYGVELLSTVHWVAARQDNGKTDDDVAKDVAAWSPRKASMFTPEHVRRALTTLRAHGLMPSDAVD